MFPFHVIEHIVPAQHIRDFPRALLDAEETVLHLHVKQYIPIDNPNPRPGDVTIIGAHANGFPKELYEPLWEDLHRQSKKHDFLIRSIWIADVAHQGRSSVLNEQLLGNDPSWFDHSRDLLHLINTKRDLMPQPIIGMGHSMGGAQLVHLAYIHPRLFRTLVLIDPVIQAFATVPDHIGPNPARLSTFRREVWPSRESAAKGFSASKFYQRWDSRVLERWVQHGLRDLPTALHSAETASPDGSKQVTLTTPKHQEVFTFLRPNYGREGVNGVPIDRKERPDLNPDMPSFGNFYRGEGPATYLRLGQLRPTVFYVFGGESDIGKPEGPNKKVGLTGIGVGGSGGEKDGKVKAVTYEGVGHLIAMEAVERLADDSAGWIGKELEGWRADQEELEKTWRTRPRKERQMIDEVWKEKVGGPPGKGKPGKDGKPKL
jgi:pimeloyl-ACP methyl ester carboxylesterase